MNIVVQSCHYGSLISWLNCKRPKWSTSRAKQSKSARSLGGTYTLHIKHLGRTEPEALWRPEYGRFMIEGTPGSPYGATLRDLAQVEDNMRRRRQIAQAAMQPGELPLTMVNYPRLGCPHELEPDFEPIGKACQSLFVPDEIINPHARFP